MAKLRVIKDEGIAAQINKNAVAMPNPTAGISYWSTYYHQPREGDNAASDMRVTMNAAPTLLREIASPLANQHTANIVREVAADMEGVYKNVSEPYAVGVADNFIGSQQYKALKQARTRGNGEEAAFVALHPGKSILASIVAMAPREAVLKGADNALTRIRHRELIANNIFAANGKFNKAGTARYDATQVNALPTDQKKIYQTDAGFQYAKEQDPTHFQQ